MQLIGDGEETLKETYDEVVTRIALLVLVVCEHLCARVEQEQSEQSQHPLEALDHRCAGKYKNATQDEGAKDAPEEHLVLILALDAEEGEEHEEHEEVVHRQ